MTPEKLKYYSEKCGMDMPREKHFAGLLAAGALIGKAIQSARKGKKPGLKKGGMPYKNISYS